MAGVIVQTRGDVVANGLDGEISRLAVQSINPGVSGIGSVAAECGTVATFQTGATGEHMN